MYGVALMSSTTNFVVLVFDGRVQCSVVAPSWRYKLVVSGFLGKATLFLPHPLKG